MLRFMSRSNGSYFLFIKAVSEVKTNGFGSLRFLHASPIPEVSSHRQYNESVSNRSTKLQIVNMLHLGDRERAIDMLFNSASKCSMFKDKDFAYILDYCARIPDPLFAMKTWRFMEERKMEINDRCYLSIIQALSKGGYLKEAFSLLHFLGETDRASYDMFDHYLNGCVSSENAVQVDQCLQLMDRHFVAKSQTTYMELLELAACRKNLSLVHDTWNEFKSYYDPGIISLRKFIWSVTKLGDLNSACDALQHMITLVVEGTACAGVSTEENSNTQLDVPVPFNIGLPCKNLNVLHKDSFMECVTKEDSRGVLVDDRFNIPTVRHEACSKMKNFVSVNCSTNPILNTDDISGDVHNINIGYALQTCLLGSSLASHAVRVKVIKVRKILRSSFSDLIHACARCNNYDLAEKLFVRMHELGLKPSARTYDSFIRVVISTKGVEYGMKVVKEMKKINLEPFDSTLAALSVGHSKVLNIDIAEALLDQISNAPANLKFSFNALLAACCAEDKLEQAIHVLSKMKILHIKPDIKTYELLFRLFGNFNYPYERGDDFSRENVTKRIWALEMDMLRNGVEHNSFTLETVIKALGAEGMIGELLRYFSMAEEMFNRNYQGTVTCNAVLHALVEAKESHMAIYVFQKMRSRMIPMDAATYNIMIHCSSNLRSFRAACTYLSLMLRNGFPPASCTYTALVKILAANGDFNEAVLLLNQSVKERLEADIVMYNTILREASQKGCIDVLELIVERMHQEKLRPDPTTCCEVFYAYIGYGFYNTAVEALQVLSLRMISQENNALQKMKAEYEDLVRCEDPDVESAITHIFDRSDEHLGAALLNLRFCTLAGFYISWLPEESLWAKRLTSQYCMKKGLSRTLF